MNPLCLFYSEVILKAHSVVGKISYHEISHEIIRNLVINRSFLDSLVNAIRITSGRCYTVRNLNSNKTDLSFKNRSKSLGYFPKKY